MSQVHGNCSNRNPQLKYLLKSIALGASVRPGPWHDFYQRLAATQGDEAGDGSLDARKIAAITLTVWKKGERFHPKKLNLQVA